MIDEVKIKRLERALAKVRKSRDYHQQQARFWKQAYDGAQEQLRAERRLRLNRWRGGT